MRPKGGSAAVLLQCGLAAGLIFVVHEVPAKRGNRRRTSRS
jgi:hypothetical protein